MKKEYHIGIVLLGLVLCFTLSFNLAMAKYGAERPDAIGIYLLMVPIIYSAAIFSVFVLKIRPWRILAVTISSALAAFSNLFLIAAYLFLFLGTGSATNPSEDEKKSRVIEYTRNIDKWPWLIVGFFAVGQILKLSYIGPFLEHATASINVWLSQNLDDRFVGSSYGVRVVARVVSNLATGLSGMFTLYIMICLPFVLGIVYSLIMRRKISVPKALER